MTKKVTFKGGWWAEIRTRWPYEADTKIAGAWTFTNDQASLERACTVTLQESIINANLPDEKGEAIPFSSDMFGKIDGRIGRKLLTECRTLWTAWQEDTDPKDTEG